MRSNFPIFTRNASDLNFAYVLTATVSIAWTPSRFSARSHAPFRKRRLTSFAVNAVQWRHHANFTMLRFRNLIFQTAASSTYRKLFQSTLFQATCLECAKCSVLHLQQSRWILLWTHVWRWPFHHNMDSGRHETCPLRVLSVLNTSWMTSLWSGHLILQRWYV